VHIFCRFWFFKILIIVGVIIGAFFIKDPTFDEGKFITVILFSMCTLIGYCIALCELCKYAPTIVMLSSSLI